MLILNADIYNRSKADAASLGGKRTLGVGLRFGLFNASYLFFEMRNPPFHALKVFVLVAGKPNVTAFDIHYDALKFVALVAPRIRMHNTPVTERERLRLSVADTLAGRPDDLCGIRLKGTASQHPQWVENGQLPTH